MNFSSLSWRLWFLISLNVFTQLTTCSAFSSAPNRPSQAVYNDATMRESSDESKDDRDVFDIAIVGAGPAGLVLAHAMRNRGYSLQVLERRDSFRPVGAAVFMHPFALNSLRNVSPQVESSLRDACTPIQMIALKSFHDDSTYVSTDQLDNAPDVLGAPFVAIRFWDMLCALKEGLPDDIFRFGHEVQGFEQIESGGVKVNFVQNDDSGPQQQSIRAKLLIDAGGIRSKVRRQLVGDKPIPRLRATYAVASAENVNAILGETDHRSASKNGERKMGFMLGDGGVSVTTATLANGDVWWTQTRFRDDPTKSIPVAGDETLQERLKERFSMWPSHVQGLVEATEIEDIIESTISELPVAWKWGQGYDVTLLGDAAHAQLPALGLGVSTAFADIEELCRQIDKFGLTRQSLRWYEFVRIPQTAFLQLASRAAYFLNLYLGSK